MSFLSEEKMEKGSEKCLLFFSSSGGSEQILHYKSIYRVITSPWEPGNWGGLNGLTRLRP